MPTNHWMRRAIVAILFVAGATAAGSQTTETGPDPASGKPIRSAVLNENNPNSSFANVSPLATLVSLQDSTEPAAEQHDEEHEHAEEAEPAHAEPDAQSAEEEHSHDEADEHEHEESASGEAEAEHDHSAHAENATGLTKALSYIGRFHVLVTHFPVALLLFGALFEIISMLGGGERARGVVRASVGFGALAALFAASLGLMNSIGADYEGILTDVFWWHRLLGLTTAGLAIVAWIAVEWRKRKPSSNNAALTARVAVLLVATFVGITGHLGGSLVFGWDYLLP